MGQGRARKRKTERPLIIGVAGGSGSGKTTVAQRIVEQIGPERVAHLQHDSYYRHRPDLSFEERTRLNYDHPDSLENDLLIAHVKTLCSGQAVDVPTYDFAQHLRSPQTEWIEPRPVILVDGILVFADEDLRKLMHLKIFVDTDADLRVIRRLLRDTSERGRSVESVIEQYLATVRPMHEQFVEPSKRHADLIIPEGGHNMTRLLDRLIQLLRELDRDPTDLNLLKVDELT